MLRPSISLLHRCLRALLPAAAGIALMLPCTLRAQIVPGAVALPDSITGVRTLSADTVYQLVSTVKVGPGALLSIPAGTLIYGNPQGIHSRLQVEKGGRIIARGTAARPVILTSPRPQSVRMAGDWEGVVILGQAVTNAPGGTAALPGAPDAVYGGADDADSSGVLEYVRIEYAGGDLGGGIRCGGLTLAGVGNRTVVRDVQVSYCRGDAFAFLGGTVNGRRLVALGCADDDLATTNGYRGRLQFFFALRDSTMFDAGTSNGMEARNDSAASANTPLSMPIVSNATFAGPFRADNQATGSFGSGGHWLNNTRYGLFNTVITGWQEGIRLDGAGIAALALGCPQPANLKMSATAVGSQTVVWGANGVQLLNGVFWFICGVENANPGNHPLVGLRAVTQSTLEQPDPRPLPGTPAATGTDFADPMLAAANNFTFSATSYKGAFDPGAARTQLWDTVWTNYRPNTTTYMHQRAGWSMVGLANRPADTLAAALYPDATSPLFTFNNGYVPDSVLRAGAGYWVQLNDARIVQHTGATVPLPRTITLRPGWNLISSGASVPAPVASITVAGTTLESSIFGFQDGYHVATTIEPGRAYWVNSATGGTMTFNP